MTLLSAENSAWLHAFVESRGHKPRVLLIGNIANNAYNDASLLNAAGFDCDVLCYDYYHIMGYPEWEDADVEHAPSDHFRPDFTGVALGGFRRPRWFAQGPLQECMAYLTSRRTGLGDEERLWQSLLVHSRLIKADGPRQRIDRVSVDLTGRMRAWAEFLRKAERRAVSAVAGALGRSGADWSALRLMRRTVRQVRAFVHGSSNRNLYDRSATPAWFASHVQTLLERFAAEFPERGDRLLGEDITGSVEWVQQWRALFANYDIVIGFATDPFWPLLCNRAYFAVEHGTIRDIPYAADSQGRRTALAYRMALHVFVTNLDCTDSAKFLSPERYSLINHPYDEDRAGKIDGAKELRMELLGKLDANFLFFHPTRQDWVPMTGYADKKNDMFLHAFAALRRQGHKVGLVACAWGANVVQSQALLAELGCSEHVVWVPPLAVIPFERMCRACDVVADQFKLGAFGGVVYKALAVGTPVMMFLDEKLARRHYREPPPIINCNSSEDIEIAARGFMADRASLEEVGSKSRSWMRENHGKYETINKQVDQFRAHSERLSGAAVGRRSEGCALSGDDAAGLAGR